VFTLTYEVPYGNPAEVMFAIQWQNGEWFVSRESARITCHVFSMPSEVHLSSNPLALDSTLFREFQHKRWTKDSRGYNFSHRVPADWFPDPGEYQIEYELELEGWEPIIGGALRVTVLPVMSRKAQQSLTENQRLALKIIRAEGPILGKTLAKLLGIAESTLRRHVIPPLRRLGVKNNRKGDGYVAQK
jgi:hypothetical protein